MSTAAWIASIPVRTCVISRSSGPRTAATMQNSLAPVAAVSSAALTSCGMSSHTDRTGEVNWPDWLQKWQSSGQPPVFRLMMPSTSTSGPQCFIRTSCASSSSSGTRSSGSFEHLDQLVVRQALAALEHLGARALEDVRHGKQDSPWSLGVRRRGRVADATGSGAR